MLLSQRPTRQNTAQQENQGRAGFPVRQKLGSCAIFTDECREAHNLLPFEEPVNFGVKCGGDCLTQCISWFPASVYDPAEIRLVNAYHLGKAVLAYSSFINCQLQIRVNRSLVEFHFLLASLDSPAIWPCWMIPKVQPLKELAKHELVPM